MKPQKRALGGVAYNRDELLCVAKALSNKESSKNSNALCVETNEKNRWVYLVVGYKESESLRKAHSDNESLLEALRSKYEPILLRASEGVLQRDAIRDGFLDVEGKMVALITSPISYTNSVSSFLQAKGFESHAKSLDEKQQALMQARMYLQLSTQACQEHLQRELLYAKSTQTEHAFALVAFAYSYKEKEGALELIKMPSAHVAFMPRVRFECGVFFDGTNNNKFNTAMREDYEKYVSSKVKIFTNETPARARSWENAILRQNLPKSQVLPLIYEDLKKSISTYGEKTRIESKYDSGGWFGIFHDKISSDANEVYEYFHKGMPKKVVDFIFEALLPDGVESSYAGEHTNIVKLYDCYDTSLDASAEAHLHICYKEKLYITGAGTYDDRYVGEKKEDAVLRGSAFAMGETGILAKVEQACADLRKALAKLPLTYVDTLVLDVFGFSRGAAEARHFVGSISKELDLSYEQKKLTKKKEEYIEYELSKSGENLYPYLIKEEGIQKDTLIISKIVFRFVGIFDTVPHYGLFQSNDVKELDLKLHYNKVSSVLHLIAQHEYRANFDLVSLKSSQDASLPKHFEEREFFGAHSDIGGGYNDDVAETIKLASFSYKLIPYVSDANTHDKEIEYKVNAWNQQHHWIENPVYILIQSKKEINNKADGFYVLKEIVQENDTSQSVHYSIYMHRGHVDTEYSQIPLEYMHNFAKRYISLKELPPLSYKKIEVLQKEKVLALDKEYLKTIKAKFLHHSAQVNIAHRANRGKENILYGQRTVHYV
ncbi:MAG: DUF2235 domain-containing protein [Sulfurimonas sp.]|jgi:uncharacterized protein (DUF2235 family)|nr:DUF2235 domain-containing protein [Sulfurimonas sp.]